MKKERTIKIMLEEDDDDRFDFEDLLFGILFFTLIISLPSSFILMVILFITGIEIFGTIGIVCVGLSLLSLGLLQLF